MIRNHFHCGWRYYFRYPLEFFPDLLCECKDVIQRGFRGYADSDVWGIDYYLSSFLPEMIHKLDKRGVPVVLVDKDEPTEEDWIRYDKQWQRIQFKIILGFRAHQQLSDAMTNEERSILRKRMEVGLGLFAKYYEHLWD